MFEQLLADVLNKVLGDYVSNLERNQLNVGIWAGDVVLRNLRLRKEALEKFQLPVQVRDGFLGELTLVIPWKNLKNTPVQVIIKDVLLLAEPSDDSAYVYDPEKERERLQKVKQEQLENAEMLSAQQQALAAGQDEQQQQRQATFTEQLVTKIVDNLQLSVSNIHVLYDDGLARPNHPFRVGFSIDGLRAVSTDSQWHETFIANARDAVYKLVKLDMLSIYWNSNSAKPTGPAAGGASSIEQLRVMLNDCISQQREANYIIRPVSMLSKLTLNKRAKTADAKYDILLQCPSLALELDLEQYTDLNFVAAYFSTLLRSREYRAWRPPRSMSAQSHPREFWKFAGLAIKDKIHEKNYKNSWAYLRSRRDQRNAYKALWKEKHMAGGVLPPGDQHRLDRLEENLTVVDIRFFRSLADVEYRKENPRQFESSAQSEAQAKSSWSSWLWGSSTSKSNQAQRATTAEQDEFIRSAIEWDESIFSAGSTESLAADSVQIKCAVQLDSGSVSIIRRRKDKKSPAESVELQLQKLGANLTMRPSSQLVSFSLEDLTVCDNFTARSLYNKIVCAKQGRQAAEHNSESPFFYLQMEANPLQGQADYVMQLSMQHAEIVVVPSLLLDIKRFFEPKCADPALAALRLAAGEKISESVKGITKAGLQFALDSHKSVDVHIDVMAPSILIPEDCRDSKAAVLFADLGHLTVTSDLVTPDQKSMVESHIRDMESSQIESLMYDKFIIQLTDMQVLLGYDVPAMMKAVDAQSSMFLIPKTSMTLQADLSILPSALNLARTRIRGHLPELSVSLSDSKYRAIKRLATMLSELSDEPSPDSPTGVDETMLELLLAAEAAKNDGVDIQLPLSPAAVSAPEIKDKKSSPSTEQLALAVQIMDRILLKAEFTVDHLCLALSRHDGDIIVAKGDVSGLNFSMVARPFDFVLDASVHCINLLDGKDDRVLSSGVKECAEKKQMAIVSLRQVDRSHPDFLTTFNGIDRNLTVQFAKVFVGLNCSSLTSMLEFATSTFMNSENDAAPSTAEDGNAEQNQTNMEVSFHLGLLEALLMMEINGKAEPLATANIAGCDVALKLNQDGTMSFQLNLESITAQAQRKYPDQQTYDHFLSMNPENATHSGGILEVVFQSYREGLPTYPGYGSQLKIRAGAPRIVYMETFMVDLRDTLLRITDEVPAVLKNGSQTQNDGSNNLFVFEAEFDAPIVTLPRNDRSKDCIVMNLGHVLAVNNLRDENSINEISVTIQNIGIVSHIGASKSLSLLKQVKAIKAEILLSMSDKKAPTKVNVEVPGIDLEINSQQLTLILDLINGVTESPLLKSDNETTKDSKSSSRALSVNTQADQPKHTLAVMVSLDQAKCSLTNSHDAFATVEVDKLNVAFNGYDDGSMSVEASIVDVALIDTSPSSKTKFREIMPPADKQRAPGKKLAVEYSVNAAKEATVICYVEKPKFTFVPEYFFRLQRFLTGAFEPSALNKSGNETSSGSVNSGKPDSSPTLKFRVSVSELELLVLRDSLSESTDVLAIAVEQIVVAQENILSFAVHNMRGSLSCMYDRAATGVQVMAPVDLTLFLDSRVDPSSPVAERDGATASISVGIPEVVTFRISYRDIRVITDIVQRIAQLASEASSQQDSQQEQQTAYARAQSFVEQAKELNIPSGREKCSVSTKGFRLIVVDDLNNLHVPMFDALVDAFDVNVVDWSSQLSMSAQLPLQIGFYNITNSHWEPLVEPAKFDINLERKLEKGNEFQFTVASDKNLDINVSQIFIKTMDTVLQRWQNCPATRSPPQEADSPYVIRNLLGFPVGVWSGKNASIDSVTELKQIACGDEVNWRFEDWRRMREDVRPRSHTINVQIQGASKWQNIQNISVDRESSRVYFLHPRIGKVQHRMVCEVELDGNVKVVTLRSTFKVVNSTSVAMELLVEDSNGNKVSQFAVAAGASGALPVLSAHQHLFRVRPEGFGMGWSKEVYGWANFSDGRLQDSLSCSNDDGSFFYARLCATVKKANAGTYPFLSVTLLPPVELENLLPYDLQFTIFDKHIKQSHSSHLKAGSSTPLHSLDPNHLQMLRIEIPDAGFGVSDVAVINNVAEAGNALNGITVRDEAGHELNLKINSVSKMNGCDSRKLSVYSPYIIINKTGLDLAYRASSLAVFHRSAAGQGSQPKAQVGLESLVKPLMFSFLSNETLRGRMAVRASETSDWSRSISLDGIGSLLEVNMKAQSGVYVALGCSISTGSGKYCLSKVVTLTPRYVVKNCLSDLIQVQLFPAAGATWDVPAGQLQPLHYVFEEVDARLLQLRQPSIVKDWSAPVQISSIGKTYTKLVNRATTTEILLCVEVAIVGATFSLAISEVKDSSAWPFRIDNESSGCDVVVRQTNAKPRYKILHGQSMLFAWDEPAYRQKTLTVQLAGFEREVDIQGIGPLVPFTYTVDGHKPHNHHHAQRTGAIAMDVVADGPMFVLKLKDWQPKRQSITSLKHAKTKSTSHDADLDAGQDGEEIKAGFVTNLRLCGIGVSIIDRTQKELLYVTLRGLSMTLCDVDDLFQSVSATIKWIQVDNQLSDARVPLLLYPTVIGRGNGTSDDQNTHPAFKLALVRSKDQSHGVDYYKYFTCLLQEMSLDLDEDFLYRLVDVFKLDRETGGDDGRLWDDSQLVAELGSNSNGGLRMYFDVLHIQPMKFNLSFYLSDRKRSATGSGGTSLNPLTYAVNILSLALGNITDAPLRLHALLVEHPIVTTDTLMQLVSQFYLQEVLGQIHKIIGSADFLGNPVGLFSSIGSGVKDVFYEPYQGFVSDRPQDIGIGLAKGTASLLKKTVYGVSDTFSKFTGSVSKGLASATMDQTFQDERNTSRAKNTPRHARQGVARGASSFAHSVVSGFTGIIDQPMKGAEKNGMGGFIKGLGKGLVGAVTKPIVGVFDLASNVTEGIKNATTAFDDRELDRIRLPRVVGPDRVLKPYNERDAMGAAMLADVDNGKYASKDEVLVTFVELPKEHNILFVTSKRVFLAHADRLDVQWTIPFKDLATAVLEKHGSTIKFQRQSDGRLQSLVMPDSRCAEKVSLQIYDALEFYRAEHGGSISA